MLPRNDACSSADESARLLEVLGLGLENQAERAAPEERRARRAVDEVLALLLVLEVILGLALGAPAAPAGRPPPRWRAAGPRGRVCSPLRGARAREPSRTGRQCRSAPCRRRRRRSQSSCRSSCMRLGLPALLALQGRGVGKLARARRPVRSYVTLICDVTVTLPNGIFACYQKRV